MPSLMGLSQAFSALAALPSPFRVGGAGAAGAVPPPLFAAFGGQLGGDASSDPSSPPPGVTTDEEGGEEQQRRGGGGGGGQGRHYWGGGGGGGDDSSSDEDESSGSDGGGGGSGYWRSYRGHSNATSLKNVAWLGPRHEVLASGSDDGGIFVWEAASGRLMHVLKGGDQAVTNVQVGCAVRGGRVSPERGGKRWGRGG